MNSAEGMERPIRLLFVDDDPHVLTALERCFWEYEDRYDLHFLNSGRQALAYLQRHPVDVIVADMRMPEMSGEQLLSAVREQYPHTIRIVLSGYSEQNSVLGVLGLAHQYLAKPCDGHSIMDTVNRTVALHRYLQDDQLRAMITRLENLPSPPAIYLEVRRLLTSSVASLNDVAEVISSDAAITAEIMKLTNSSFFARRNSINTVQQAVSVLGLDTLQAIVLSSGLVRVLKGSPLFDYWIRGHSRKTLMLAELARLIAIEESMPVEQIDQCCTAGLLSHIGTIVLMSERPSEFRQAAMRVENENISIFQAERDAFGTTHAELGAYLLGLWGFSHPVAEAVAFHHQPSRAQQTRITPLTAVHAAQSLLTAMHNDPTATASRNTNPMDLGYLERLGLLKRVETWRDLAHARFASN